MSEKPGFNLTNNQQPLHRSRYGRRRLLPAEATLRRRTTRWCAKTRWRLVMLNYPGIVRLFRDQEYAQQRERWTTHL